jgi:hypothetical protein
MTEIPRKLRQAWAKKAESAAGHKPARYVRRGEAIKKQRAAWAAQARFLEAAKQGREKEKS